MSQRDRLTYLVIAGLALIGLALWIGWFVQTHERVAHEYRSGMSERARRNPFYAAELFLREQGVDVGSVSGRSRLHELPPVGDILLVNNFGPNLSPQRHQHLMQWLEDGGHLITTANKHWDEEEGKSGDQLLDELGVQLLHTETEDEAEQEPETNSTATESDASDTAPTPDSKPVTFDQLFNNVFQPQHDPVSISFNSGETVEVYFDDEHQLIDSQDRASVRIGSENSIHLMQVPVGQGLVTIMSDNQFLKHRSGGLFASVFSQTTIKDFDHAYYLWLLVGGDSKVWLLYNVESEDLETLLWRNARYACLGSIALLIGWLWWQRNRFGPVAARLDQPRRNLLEHLHMSATYAWRQDRGQQLYADNCEHIRQLIAKRHPQIAQLEPEALCQQLGELCEMEPDKIHHALFADWQSEREFIQLSHVLQQLRKKL